MQCINITLRFDAFAKSHNRSFFGSISIRARDSVKHGYFSCQSRKKDDPLDARDNYILSAYSTVRVFIGTA